MLQTSGRVSFLPLELYNTEARHVAGLPPHADTCGAFHGSGPSNFNEKLHIFHGHIPATERRKRRERREGKE